MATVIEKYEFIPGSEDTVIVLALVENHAKLWRRNTVGSLASSPFFHIGSPNKCCIGRSTWNSALAKPEDFMKLRIAVADDNEDFLNELISVLETEFDVVVTARDGKSALESIRSCSPDVVVLDLVMPGLTGIEVARELSKHTPRPAIVICSVESDPEIIEVAREAGALGYVFKARIWKDLVAAVKSIVCGQSFVSPP